MALAGSGSDWQVDGFDIICNKDYKLTSCLALPFWLDVIKRFYEMPTTMPGAATRGGG